MIAPRAKKPHYTVTQGVCRCHKAYPFAIGDKLYCSQTYAELKKGMWPKKSDAVYD